MQKRTSTPIAPVSFNPIPYSFCNYIFILQGSNEHWQKTEVDFYHAPLSTWGSCLESKPFGCRAVLSNLSLNTLFQTPSSSGWLIGCYGDCSESLAGRVRCSSLTRQLFKPSPPSNMSNLSMEGPFDCFLIVSWKAFVARSFRQLGICIALRFTTIPVTLEYQMC